MLKLLSPLALLLPLALAGDRSGALDNREICTLAAVGRETGFDSLTATLRVPRSYNPGVEYHGGGLFAYHPKCDFALYSFFSEETERSIIQTAPQKTLTDALSGRLVEARLGIIKFSDDVGRIKFFVTAVQEMRPITNARTADEAQSYFLPASDKSEPR